MRKILFYFILILFLIGCTSSEVKELDDKEKIRVSKLEAIIGGFLLEYDYNENLIDRVEISYKDRYEGRFVKIKSKEKKVKVDKLKELNWYKIRITAYNRKNEKIETKMLQILTKHKTVEYIKIEDRDIFVYTPESYNDSDKIYPVIYMNDGEELFSTGVAGKREWEIDETLNRLRAENGIGDCVVVAIGAKDRSNEYTPYYDDERRAGGGASEYYEFIEKKIMPYIENSYRVSKDREDRYIGGASLGGIFALWTVNNRTETFKNAIVFSPVLGRANWQLCKDIAKEDKKDIRIFLYAGVAEGFAESCRWFVGLLVKGKGYVVGEDIYYVEREDGTHNQNNEWGDAFPEAVKFYFGK